MKREPVEVTISLHHIQSRIIKNLKYGNIKFERDSLRDIAKIIGVKTSPQQIKHHLEQLLKLGAIQKINAEYVYIEILPKSC